MPAKMNGLTDKQKKFAEAYIGCFNATEAAIKAGYSEKTAGNMGWQNLQKDKIKNYIDELREEINDTKDERIATANETLEFFTEMLRDEKTGEYIRIEAAKCLAKYHALFKDNNNINISKVEIIDDVSS
jgi:phage terminase small subunit